MRSFDRPRQRLPLIRRACQAQASSDGGQALVAAEQTVNVATGTAASGSMLFATTGFRRRIWISFTSTRSRTALPLRGQTGHSPRSGRAPNTAFICLIGSAAASRMYRRASPADEKHASDYADG